MANRNAAIARLEALLRHYFSGCASDHYHHVARVIAHDEQLHTALGAAGIVVPSSATPEKDS